MYELNKKLLFAPWAAENKHFSIYHTFYGPLNKIFSNIITFDPQKNMHLYGQEGMNKKFLELIKKEKPDYIFFLLSYDEFYLETILKIREISPYTITINYFGDDDTRFETFTRYYATLLDYCIMLPQIEAEIYDREGIRNTFFSSGTNLDHFKPKNVKKEFDVSFVGTPKIDRYHLVKYLHNNGINIRVFGAGWDQYTDIKEILGGSPDHNELVYLINKSRINICFSKNNYKKPHLKGRIIETGACNSFSLVEYAPILLEFFKEDREIVMFKNKKELLEKIRYYLKNEKEREEIANNMYKKIIKDHDIYNELKSIFYKIEKNGGGTANTIFHRDDKSVAIISKEDFNLDLYNLKEKLKDKDFIVFYKKERMTSPYRNSIQAYSLKKSGKSISCCDYYLHSRSIGDYLGIESGFAFKSLNKHEFHYLIDLSQLMIAKEYFIKNMEKFKKAYFNDDIDFVNEGDTAFVSIPLVRILDSKKIPYHIIKRVCYYNAKFFNNLVHLISQKKLLTSKYFYYLILESLRPGKRFILRYLLESLFNKNKIKTLKKLITNRFMH